MELVATALIAFVAGIFFANSGSPKTNHNKNHEYQEKPKLEKPEYISLEEQFLEASKSCFYETKNLLNHTEKLIYWKLVRFLKKSYCVNPQVSLGEILICEDELGYRAINSKRSDFVITDRQFRPIAIIEYQGSGHYQSNSENRDATKRHALTRAGIDYIEESANKGYINMLKRLFNLKI